MISWLILINVLLLFFSFFLINYKNRINNYYTSNSFALSITFGFGLVTFMGLYYHECWVDEAHSWLIARDVDLTDLPYVLRYEGTPGLWHIIIMPFAKYGCHYFSMKILSLLFSLTTVYFIIKYAPFNIFTRCLLVFSYFIAFEFSIISRTYNISVVLMIMLATIYQLKDKKYIIFSLLLGLLANTNVHSLGTAAILSTFFLYDIYKIDRKKFLISSVIIVISLLISVFQILTPADSPYAGFIKNFHYINIIYSLVLSVIPIENSSLLMTIILFPLILYFWVLIVKLLYDYYRPGFIMFLIIMLWLNYIFVFKYGASLRHYGLVFINIIFILWITIKNNYDTIIRDRRYKVLIFMFNFFLWIAFNIYLKNYITDYQYYYCCSKSVSDKIKYENIEKETFYCIGGYVNCAVMPYLPHAKFIMIPQFEKKTFIIRDKNWINNKKQLTQKQLHDIIKNSSNIKYLLTNEPLYCNDILDLIYKPDNRVCFRGSYYWLYKRK